MRKQGIFCIGLIGVFLLFGCSGVVTIGSNVKVYTLAEIQKSISGDAVESEELSGGLLLDPNAQSHFNIQGEIAQNGLVVKLYKGQKVPLKLFVEMPFASVESGDNKLVLKQDMFVYFCKDGVYVSPDGKTYAPVHKPKAIHKLYGTKKGYLSIGIGASKNENTTLKVGLGVE